MKTIDYIKDKIKALFENSPSIHISTTTTHPKQTIESAPACIMGVYPNMFRIEEREGGYPRYHSIRYTDVLIGQVRIAELSPQD